MIKIYKIYILIFTLAVTSILIAGCQADPLQPIRRPPGIVDRPLEHYGSSVQEQVYRVFSKSQADYTLPSDPRPPALDGSGNYDYLQVKLIRSSSPGGAWTTARTRALSSLEKDGFIPSSEKPRLGTYGGDLSRPDTATGFFYTKKENGRWWMIDPEGYRMLSIGITSFSPAGTAAERAGQQNVYGDNEAWTKGATAHLKDDLGFNSLGAWANDTLIMRYFPFPYTKLIYFVTTYAEEAGLTYQDSGHQSFRNNVIPVFDPGFEQFADQRAASTMAKLRDDKYLVGYFSDNELPAGLTLNNYLNSPDDEMGKYSRAVAWEWLRRRHGPGATAANIGGNDLDDFREFVFDYYAQIVSNAIKHHDPNHMYLGPRLNGGTARTSPGIWRAFGRYCGAIGFNYYSVWDPDFTILANWEYWSGKPAITTEWYTKGMDSGLANYSGAGWVVETQDARGLFYEQFVLNLIESGTVVGWHWFKYKDNDPSAPAPDPSNVDGNKGIINTAFQEYTDLTSRMRITNFNTYRLVDYFVGRNGR